MKVKYLGTAAAEGIPAVFCDCDNCRTARTLGGKNIRTRSQALVDDCLMIDLPPDSYAHSLNYNIDLTNIHHYLITHTHADHFYPRELCNLSLSATKLPEGSAYHLWGGQEMVDILTPLAAKENMAGRLVLHHLPVGKPTLVGQHLVTALPARHGTRTPYIYLIEQQGKAMLYAHDTGPLTPEVWDYLFMAKQHIDLVSMDCAYGWRLERDEQAGHMGFVNVQEMCAMLEQKGYTDYFTKRVISHFHHRSPAINYKNADMYENRRFIMPYDGLEVIF